MNRIYIYIYIYILNKYNASNYDNIYINLCTFINNTTINDDS